MQRFTLEGVPRRHAAYIIATLDDSVLTYDEVSTYWGVHYLQDSYTPDANMQSSTRRP